MKLNNEFVVAAPVEHTWRTLLDLERVARCLPGADLTSSGDDGNFRGGMKVKLGPMVVAYDGVARLVDVDEDRRTTTLEVQGREAKGQGTAAAKIQNRLEETGEGGTRVLVETDLQVTGRQAQFGRGIMEQVAGGMLGDFAERLEQLILADLPTATRANGSAGAHGATDAAGAAGRATPTGAEEPAPAAEDVLDVGSMVAGSLGRYAPAGGVLLAAALLLVVARAFRGRHTIRIRLDLKL